MPKSTRKPRPLQGCQCPIHAKQPAPISIDELHKVVMDKRYLTGWGVAGAIMRTFAGRCFGRKTE